VFPRLRLGRRWLNLLWTIPLVAIVLVIGFGITTWLRTLPEVQTFISTYPGTVPRAEPQEFPWWLRWQHLLNVIFLVPIVRAGLQLWAGRPRAYWAKPAHPGKDWLRIQRAYPEQHGWSMRDDAVGLSPQVGLPGKRLSSGLARWWHLSVTLLWVANGILFYVLLFATGQWVRTVPTSWDVFPNALSAAVQYLSFDFPEQNSWVSYNSLQLLSYFVTVFIAAPLALLTGLMTLFFATGALENLNHIVLGTNDSSWAGAIWFAIAVAVGGVLWAIASPVTLRYPVRVQKIGQKLLGPINKLF
jgi:sulfoxide reductase catalytic subunit YedY